jgi:two-component system phosphate regulon sensor histidine kinase PhoR
METIKKNNNFFTYFFGIFLGLLIGFLAVQFFYYIEYGNVLNIVSRVKQHNFSGKDFMILVNFLVLGVLGSYIFVIRRVVKKCFTDLNSLKTQSEDKDKLLGFAAHALRSPATNIKWGIDAFLHQNYGPLNKKQEKIMQELYGNTRQLINLIGDYIDLSKLGLGHLEVSLTSVAVETFWQDIERVLQVYDNIAKLKNITVERSIQYARNRNENPRIMADMPRLISVVENLMENAANYTFSGGKITLKMNVTKDYFLLQISDTGIGIDPEDQSKIFSEFFRSMRARELKSTGSGIGLFVVRLIVQAHKGKIWFSSEKNKGTTFYVQIPLSFGEPNAVEKLEVFLKNI